MRKLVYYVAASLDGYIARLDGSVDWLPTSNAKEDYGYAKFIARVDAFIVGRKTYEQMLAFGPWPYDGLKCYVLSRHWAGQRDVQAEFIGGNIAALLRRIKRPPGRDIWLMGGSESAQAFFEAGLVDEVILTIVPTLLGEGLPLFRPRRMGAKLKLRETKAFTDGLVQLHYDVPASSSVVLRAGPRGRAAG
jgi:dihydrofolate reductase